MSEDLDYQRVVFGSGWALNRNDYNLGGMRLDRALRVLESCPEARTGRIVEAGCGVGRFTLPLTTHLPEAQIFAFDLSAAAVAKATHKGGGVYTVADAISLPYASASFDAVVFFDLLEHLPQPGEALAEFARVLSRGSVMHGYVPCEGQWQTLHRLMRRQVHAWTARHAGHVQHFDHAAVAALVEQAGFEIMSMQYSYHLLGQALDVATFAAREMILRRRGGGAQKPDAYYDRSALGSRGVTNIYLRARQVVESLTYVESRLLGRWPWALGVHITAKRGR
ncbi:MAG: methyltransferase domain-containing protein [Anaerolineae bacterium]|nr:methyltransferase domain-containing protein [Anaerolineae bacterium]